MTFLDRCRRFCF